MTWSWPFDLQPDFVFRFSSTQLVYLLHAFDHILLGACILYSRHCVELVDESLLRLQDHCSPNTRRHCSNVFK